MTISVLLYYIVAQHVVFCVFSLYLILFKLLIIHVSSTSALKAGASTSSSWHEANG